MTDQLNILDGQPPANIKDNLSQTQEITYVWRIENSGRSYFL